MKILDVIDEERPLLLKYPSTSEKTMPPKGYNPTLSPVVVVVHPPSQPEGRRVTHGHILLFLVAMLFGTLNVSLRGVYALQNPPTASVLSTVRGWLAVLCFLPLLGSKTSSSNSSSSHTTPSDNANGNNSMITKGIPKISSPDKVMMIYKTRDLVLVALELAVWDAGAQGLENIALIYISSARVAFLSQLTVVCTPILSLVAGVRPRTSVWWACGLAVVGLVLMSSTHRPRHHDDTESSGGKTGTVSSFGWVFTLGLGDFLCLAGALSWSTYLIRMSKVSEMFPEVHLQSLKSFFQASLYSSWCLIAWWTSGQSQWKGWENGFLAWGLLLYSAAGPGTLAVLLQQRAQATVSATVTSVVLSMEPVFTALFGRLLLGERTSWMEKLGGGCILVAAMVATR
mmetsp:Transcript_11352/g.21663  ORF Transcript_11352/g.21663 Transcript_11352/m.21663 type:complete len:399 (+) Transcript_11352:79-1275(+)